MKLRVAITVSHTIRDKEKLIARVRRLKGQFEGIERALEAGKPCGEILRQLASARGAMTGLTAEVMEDHLREHVLHAETEADRQQGGEELIEAIRTYMK
jgi:DNA-binding FrmR family transcriptional regulator